MNELHGSVVRAVVLSWAALAVTACSADLHDLASRPIGGVCERSSQCEDGLRCERAVPGGMCTKDCDGTCSCWSMLNACVDSCMYTSCEDGLACSAEGLCLPEACVDSPGACQGSQCGDRRCDAGEVCPQDCGDEAVCGDLECEGGENVDNCPSDCGGDCPGEVCDCIERRDGGGQLPLTMDGTLFNGGSGSLTAGTCGGFGPEAAFIVWTTPYEGRYRFHAMGDQFVPTLYVRWGECGGTELGCNGSGDVTLDLAGGAVVFVFVDAPEPASSGYWYLEITQQ